MVSDEEDQDRMGQLLTINDLINGVLHNYDVFKSGDGEKRDITLGDHIQSSSNVVGDSIGAICLIDFDDDVPAMDSGLTASSSVSGTAVQQMGDLFGDLDFSGGGSSVAPASKPSGMSDINQLFMPASSAPAANSSAPKKNGIHVFN
jgi:hypothetical protein